MANKDPSRSFLDFVKEYLVVKDAKCYRHCENETRFVSLFQKASSLVGGYACPGNYVSRVVYFAEEPDSKWFEQFLQEQVGKRVRKRDIRYATRHGWELGSNAEKEISFIAPKTGSVKQFYWTFYPSSDEEVQSGTFLCPKEEGGCGLLFTKLVSDSSRQCPRCRHA